MKYPSSNQSENPMSDLPHHLDDIMAREHRQRRVTEAFLACLGIAIVLLAVMFA
jgi:hypothetical protein